MVFSTIVEVLECRKKVVRITNEKVEERLKESRTGVEFLQLVKFTQKGYDPLFERPINFIEQVNQTFTYLVSLSAVEILLTFYPNKAFKVNFGTSAGYDIESIDGDIICECFASTTPDSNNKLKSDAERLNNNQTASKRYLIYYAEIPKNKHVANISGKYKDVEIIALKSI